MKWGAFTETFNKPGSRNIRLALSLLFIMLATIVVMTIFSAAKVFFHPNITVWETHVYTILFTGIIAPVVALFVLLNSEGLYGKVSKENEERKLAEKALRESESRLKQTERILYRSQEAGEVGSWHLDLRKNDLWWSPETYRMFGRPSNTRLSYEDFLSIVHEEDRADLDRAWKAALNGAPYDIEHRIVADGRVKWVHEKAVLDYDEHGAPIFGIGTVADITERKRAEEELRDSQAHLNSIFRAAPTGIGVVVDRIIKEANDRLCEMTGYTSGELLGKNASILYPSDEDYEYVGREKYAQIEKRGTGTVETRWRRKDGSVIDVLLSSTPMEPGDLHAGVTFTALDITKRKRAEEELKAARDQAELYVDLMGHDINNIHQAALGYLELARDMPGDSRDEYLDNAMEALKRSARLINNVRKLQKLQDDRVQFHDVDVCAVLGEVYSKYAKTPGKTVTLNLNRYTHCHVRANDLLHDVFSNLVGNAIKHTGDHAHVSINLDIDREHGIKYYRVQVEDDGPGIPDGSKKTLFNRSLKGTPRAKGMGLGLYIVKTLVEGYHGRVWVENRVQGDHTKGTRFMVMLPAIEK